MNKKSGISMAVLLITMIAVIILLSAMTLSTNDASNMHNLSAFTNNLTIIEDYISSCQILKEDLPFLGDLSITEVREKIIPEYLSFFNAELISNGDELTSSFKEIDKSKFVTNKEFTEYEENDIYIFSETTGIVYYLAGLEIDENVYFSVSDKITNIVK